MGPQEMGLLLQRATEAVGGKAAAATIMSFTSSWTSAADRHSRVRVRNGAPSGSADVISLEP